MNEGVWRGEEGVTFPGAGVRGNGEPVDVVAANQAKVLCRSNTRTEG